MAEKMAEKRGSKKLNQGDEKNDAKTTNASEQGGKANKNAKGADCSVDPELEALLDVVLEAEKHKLESDPSKFLRLLVKLMVTAAEHKLKPLTLSLVQDAAKGSVPAMKLLLELCQLIPVDSADDRTLEDISFLDLMEAGFDREGLAEAQKQIKARTLSPELTAASVEANSN